MIHERIDAARRPKRRAKASFDCLSLRAIFSSSGDEPLNGGGRIVR